MLYLQAWVASVGLPGHLARPPNSFFAVFMEITAIAFGVGWAFFFIDDCFLVWRRSTTRLQVVIERYSWWALLVERWDVFGGDFSYYWRFPLVGVACQAHGRAM